MMKVVSVEQMRQIEAAADAAGISYAEMMENAGTAVALRVLDILAQLPDPAEARVTLLIGPGNNGGDGLVAGRVIAEQSGALVRFYLLTRRDDDDPHLKADHATKGCSSPSPKTTSASACWSTWSPARTSSSTRCSASALQLPLRDNVTKLLRAVHQAIDEDEDAGRVARSA